ncbi:MAG TPA: hypothetical protein VIH42_11695, partial [Thermoguttaceae bacterium]
MLKRIFHRLLPGDCPNPPWRMILSPFCSGVLIWLLGTAVWAAEEPARGLSPSAAADGTVPFITGESWQTVSVQKTYNNTPFKYQINLQARRDGYRVFALKYPSPVTTPIKQNNTVPAEYYLPDGIAPVSLLPQGDRQRPAVICMHILDGNDVLTDMVCSVLAMRGIPAIMFKLPYYGERGLPDGPMVLAKDPKLLASAIAQAGEDVRRTIDVLASRPEVDPSRIGITGIS